MKIDSETQQFIKGNQGILKSIIEDRIQDYLNKVVDEPDLQKKEVLSMFVKEFRMALRVIDNISNLKDKKKPDEEFTGV